MLFLLFPYDAMPESRDKRAHLDPGPTCSAPNSEMIRRRSILLQCMRFVSWAGNAFICIAASVYWLIIKLGAGDRVLTMPECSAFDETTHVYTCGATYKQVCSEPDSFTRQRAYQ